MLVFCSATKAPLERGSDGGKSSQFVLLGLREVGSILLMACGYIGLTGYTLAQWEIAEKGR
jgi:hypothetical protein